MAASKTSAIKQRRVSAGLFDRTDAEEPEGPQPAEVKSPRRKRTYHLSDETVLLLGDLQATEHRRTGTKPELSDLVDEAIRQYVTAKLAPVETPAHQDG